MMSPNILDANTPATGLAASAVAMFAERIASDPEWAAALAGMNREESFRAALVATLRTAASSDRSDADLDLPFPLPQIAVRLPHWPAAARRGWHPVALEWGAQGAELVWACGMPRADAPFHGEQMLDLRMRPFNRLFKVSTPLDDRFVAELEAEALPLKGLIFHMSRCGSTLVAQMLKAWPGVRVVSEPDVLDTAMGLGRSGHDPRGLLLRGVVAALAQPAGSDRGVILKLDAWHALAFADIAPRLGTPWLFVYRDPLEVLASHRREPGRHTVPGMLADAWLPEDAQGARLAREAHAACVLGAICAAIVPHARRENLLHYEELPQAVVSRVAAQFDLGCAPAAKHLAQAGARHAKRPFEPFVADTQAKRATADRGMYESVGRWMQAPYRALEEIRTVLRRLRLPLDCDLAALRADLAAVAAQGWHAHFNTQYYDGEWSGIALRAQAHGRSPLYADPSCGEFSDTEAMRRCRYIPRFLAQLGCAIESVRFLKLAAGAGIREHRDPGLRFEDGVVRLHVPVYTHARVEFALGGERVPLAEGECWYLNFDLPHRIVNRGDSDRVHLVIDARVNAWVKDWFARLRAHAGC